MATILVVDDDMHLRRILCLFLKDAGHLPIEARNTDEAAATLEATPIDLVILDVMMPGGDGLSFCKKLKAIPAAGRLPILMCTARSRKEDIVGAIRSGADDYIVKPFTREIVLKKVERALAPEGVPGTAAPQTDSERRTSRRASVDWVVSWASSKELGTNTLYKNRVMNISSKGFAFEFDRCQTCTGYELSTVHPMCLLARHAKRFPEGEDLEFVLSISSEVVVEVKGRIAHVYQPPGWEPVELVGVSLTDVSPQAEEALNKYSY